MFPIVEHTLILRASVQDGVVGGHVYDHVSQRYHQRLLFQN